MSYIFFIYMGIFLRIIPHLPNFAPITAIAIFGGYYLNRKFSLIVPLIVMIISDFLISPKNMFHSTTLFVYASFLISGLIGITLKKLNKGFYILGGTILASLQFFIITNFGVWLTTNMYLHTFSGLIQCYIAAVPFYRNTLLGDLFYVVTFFSVYELMTKVVLPKFQLIVNHHKEEYFHHQKVPQNL